MKIVYVILHYMAEKDTIECVKSIMRATQNSTHETSIIVVDNGSPNNSYDTIEKTFRQNSMVKVLFSETNVGFARGNNIGFEYAKYTSKADFIVMLNNDTILTQLDFNEVLVRKFEENNYAILGPDIVTADGYHQNPGNKQSWSFKELRIDRLKKRVRIALSYLGMDSMISTAVKNVKEIYRTTTLDGDVKNTILHGACWIFSPQYIKSFDGICADTFLYMEEDILKLYADYYGFLMMYTSELSIFHKEDVATNMVEGTIDEKARLKYKRLIESSLVYSKIKRKMIKNAIN